MTKTLVGALALASLPSALAFRNTSPFFLFSTADIDIKGNDADVAQAPNIAGQVDAALQDCPSRTYFVVQQEHVSSADYVNNAAPRLGSFMSGNHKDVKKTLAVSEVLGYVDSRLMTIDLEKHCKTDVEMVSSYAHNPPMTMRSKDDRPLIVQVSMAPPPTSSGRAAALLENDSFLEHLIAGYAGSEDYTVIYTTTPQSEEQVEATLQTQHKYEMEDSFGDAMQMELKRDISSHRSKRAKAKEGGLFEKYQFLSPGLFMGFAAIIPLFFILLVGLKAILGLEVSYFAFSKEMGPTAQKKQG